MYRNIEKKKKVEEEAHQVEDAYGAEDYGQKDQDNAEENFIDEAKIKVYFN
jgi:hypothetical protein